MATKLASPFESDRLLAAMSHAPIVEASPAELLAFEEGLADIRAGRVARAEQVRADIQSREHE